MSDDHHDIHHRIDSLQQDISSIGTNLGEGLSKLTSAVEKLVVLETEHKSTRETLARYGEKIDKHDARLDTMEQKVPVYDHVVEDRKANSLMIRRAVIGTVISALVVGMLGLVWTAIVN